MKQKDLLRLFYQAGWYVLREGSNHIVLTDGENIETVPRHKEINEMLAKAIVKRRNLNGGKG